MRTHSSEFDRAGLDRLIQILSSRGFQVIGPTVRDAAIVFEPIEGAACLPAGWTTELAPGRYRLEQSNSESLFDHWTGPGSLKRFLHPARVRVVQAQRSNGVFTIIEEPLPAVRYAFLGVRPCDLAAVAAQDRVLLNDRFTDDVYAANRANNFFVAVNCTRSAPTCFCASFETGPRARGGYDIALTEMGGMYLAEAGTPAGAEVLDEMGAPAATAGRLGQAEELSAQAGASQTRRLDPQLAYAAIERSFEHAHWDEVAKRCMACANCTMSCPTCFCSNTEDSSDLAGARAERWRVWDSCFTQSFSYIHGGSVRTSGKARYRQWISHKLARWQDQFGMSGCTGCGRCIVWCPAGIDITEEVAALQAAAK